MTNWVFVGALTCLFCAGAVAEAKAAEPDRTFRKRARASWHASPPPAPTSPPVPTRSAPAPALESLPEPAPPAPPPPSAPPSSSDAVEPLVLQAPALIAGGAAQTSPRVWPIAVGSVLFGVAYGAAVYFALSGDATSYGPAPMGSTRGIWDFGSPGLLFIPVLGPILFQGTFCDDARDFFKDETISDEPGAACHGSRFWDWDAVVQLVGVGLGASGFLFPVSKRLGQRGALGVVPLAGTGRSGLMLHGSF